MLIVVDANPFIASFLQDSSSRKILLSEKITIYSPAWLKDEFERNEFELKKKFPSSADFSKTKEILFKFVKLVPASAYFSFIVEATGLAKHSKDVPYFALALHLKCPLWSEEKSFKAQSAVKIYSTSELLKELEL